MAKVTTGGFTNRPDTDLSPEPPAPEPAPPVPPAKAKTAGKDGED